MAWSLYEKENFLKPLTFSNGKNQEDIVNEILDLFNKGKRIVFIHGVCGTGKCLDGESLIFCKSEKEENFGYKKISDLEGKKGKIISLNKKGNLVKSNFKNVRKTGKKKLYKLKTRTGREIIASSNHPFLTVNENGIEWKQLKNLTKKDYVCISNNINFNNEKRINEDEIKIIAHLIAEGNLKRKAGSPRYTQSKIQNSGIRKDYINSLKKFFPEGEIKEEKGSDEITCLFRNMDTRKGTTNKLMLLMDKYGLKGKGSKEKFIPNIIFNLDKKQIALFLSRLFSCDGGISTRKNQTTIEYSSISKRLILDVSILLQRFGIHHTISSKKFRKNKEYSWRISISNQKNLKKFIEDIGFIGRKKEKSKEVLKKLKIHKYSNIDKVPKSIRDFLKKKGYSFMELDRMLNYEKITKARQKENYKQIIKNKSVYTPRVFKQTKTDFLRSHINKINRRIQNKSLSFICNEDILWDKIKSIEFAKKDETYDLEVPGLKNFVSNGMIVHNSGIALNLAKELGKSSVVVPSKSLQRQYKKDYEEEKHLLKDNGEKLDIRVITGRNNHECKFLKDNKKYFSLSERENKKDANANLKDIFEKKEKEKFSDNTGVEHDESADNYKIPCKIEIKEKNLDKIKEYLKENPKTNPDNIGTIKDVKRLPLASVCPYWSPVFPKEYDIDYFKDVKKREYEGLDGEKFVFYKRKPGCGFYEQFDYYIDADVIVFNALKYKIESLMNRKPLTEVEIIDECDEFLDGFSQQKNVNIDLFENSLIYVPFDENQGKDFNEMFEILKHMKKDRRVMGSVESEEIVPLKQTGIYDLFRILLESEELFEYADEESYIFDVLETAKMFEGFFNETYVVFNRNKNNQLTASIVTTNLSKKFQELVDKNKYLVLMSGTLHSKEVLRDIFGLNDFEIIEAETTQQGQIDIQRTGLEKNCKYSNFKNGNHSRGEYLKALNKCVEVSKKPTVVQVNSFKDLPDEEEKRALELDSLESQEKVREKQNRENEERTIRDFKSGREEVLFSTKVSRGIDFPGSECRSIVFTKYPNPNVRDAFWKILNQTKPLEYWKFYKDKARRELLQKIYRGLRFPQDHLYLLSPDSRVLEAFE